VTTGGREGASGDTATRPRVVYRLRDLGRGGRWVALAFALALSVAPMLAFSWAVPDWAPSGDVALMGIRALDVGTARTPLVGGPSSGGKYVGSDDHVNHPGPLHYYLLAVAIRLFGGDLGMPLVSVLIVETCVLLAAWAVFRELGAAAGSLAAVLLGAVMFTTGTSSLIDPVSSRMAGYPLLCASVLCWCVLSGDLRLLPLATAVVSFTAQQHLSVAPASVVLTAGAVVGVIVALVRRRPELAWWCGWSVLVALVLWAPVLLDQVISSGGNLGRIFRFAGGTHGTLGAMSALRQLANTLGLPPLLGRTEITGGMLMGRPSTLTWSSAVVAVVLVTAIGLRWRTRNPRQATLAVMVAVVALAGFANGSSVPTGMLEESRISFYHWTFALAFFTWLVLGLGTLDLMGSRLAARAALAHALTALALAAVILPAAINTRLDRTTNHLEAANSYLPSRYLHVIGDAVVARRRELGAQSVIIVRGGDLFAGLPEAVGFELIERNIDVRAPLALRGSVDDDRLVEPSAVETGLILLIDGSMGSGLPPRGELLADVDLHNGPDADAFQTLLGQARSAPEVRLGRAAEEGIDAVTDPLRRLQLAYTLPEINRRPEKLLTARTLRFLRDHPIEQPRLDPALIERILASVKGNWTPQTAVHLRLYLVDRTELLRIAPKLEF